MWKLKLPDTGDINGQLNAALQYVSGEYVYQLSPAERLAVHTLYAAYDQRLGEPDPCLIPAELANCADALHGAYDEVQKGKRLAGLRDTLMSAVIECPLCGAAPATTLDHHLPHDQYRALSINPRNLVPSCMPCNRAKGTLQPVAGQGMIHVYFQDIPKVTFLKAASTYEAGALDVSFSVDGADLDPALAGRLAFQLDRMKLNERHKGPINIFLFAIKPMLEMFRGLADEREQIRNFLGRAATSYSRDHGANHWKVAVVRSLSECDAFLDDPWTYLDKPPKGLDVAA